MGREAPTRTYTLEPIVETLAYLGRAVETLLGLPSIWMLGRLTVGLSGKGVTPSKKVQHKLTWSLE